MNSDMRNMKTTIIQQNEVCFFFKILKFYETKNLHEHYIPDAPWCCNDFAYIETPKSCPNHVKWDDPTAAGVFDR